MVKNSKLPCRQNTAFPKLNPFQSFPSPLSQHAYEYQPLIHVPTKTSSATVGEMGASIDMLRAQVLELSKRMESMESRVLQFENSVSNDIFLLKNTLYEHSGELLHVRDLAENANECANKMNESIVLQKTCTDDIADAVSQTIHLCRRQIQLQKQASFKSTATNAQLGMIRRRLSKVEECANEFFEHFESFKNVKDIISNLSEHINECDRDISLIVTKKYDEDTQQNDENNIQSIAPPCVYTATDLNDYFSKYNEVNEVDEEVNEVNRTNNNNNNNVDTNNNNNVDTNNNNSEINDDDFEKLF